LEKARASLAVAEQSLSDAYLRAPFAGTVATKSKQIGELVTSADQVYYILGNAGLEVVANVPEVDVARIRVGMPVSGTLDAFSSDKVFNLEVESIDPDQTTIDGVVYYKTHFVFKEVDPAFRPGMSVNLTMIANQKDNVIVVPRRAVTQKNGSSTIRIAPITNGALPEIRNVKIGLKGDMLIEVMEGINEGESVVVSEKKP
jgi:HlyD family secretion protein